MTVVIKIQEELRHQLLFAIDTTTTTIYHVPTVCFACMGSLEGYANKSIVINILLQLVIEHFMWSEDSNADNNTNYISSFKGRLWRYCCRCCFRS